MQKQEHVNTAEGKQCTATIISPYWIATSESCCDGAVKGILEFDDWRTGTDGNKSMAPPSYSVPSFSGGRKRRTVEFHRRRTKRDTDTYNDATCIETGFCKKNGICLIRSGRF